MPSVFLSSTFVDLAEIRKGLSAWLSEVFGVDLVIMETFGSDAAPPDITSVRNVRDCDIFIGIYARRYGTVDAITGKSITELELDEAERAYSGGIIKDILLYLLTDSAQWPANLEESSESGVRKLARLRERLDSNTPSYFTNASELLLFITRDLHRKLIQHFSISPLHIRDLTLPAGVDLSRPVGMEFLGSAHKDYLIGRSAIINELVTRIESDSVLLLLGDSGVGKTSLLHAGVMPEAIRLGWRPVYVRPLGLPASDVTHQLQASLFKGRPAYHGLLLPFVVEVLAVLPEKRLLVIIDQFEDVLVARSPAEVDRLIGDLKLVHQSPDTRLLPDSSAPLLNPFPTAECRR